MENEFIRVVGAKENNLKNVDLVLPRNKLIVFTGVSGSGKSTLAFDTIFAEGQRKYMESLSSYARQFLGQMQKPDVEKIEGLSPAIAIDQKTTNHNPRSTVGTTTEIYDYLRLLFAKVGVPFCPHCKREISSLSVDEIVDKIYLDNLGKKMILFAQIADGEKGSHQNELKQLKADGTVRCEIDGVMYNFDDISPDEINLDKNKKHTILAVCDRLILKEENKSRLAESLEYAISLSGGIVLAEIDGEKRLFSTKNSCAKCGFSLPEITPRLFSFNATNGACGECDGLGFVTDVDKSEVLKNAHLSLLGGAFSHCGFSASYGFSTKAYFASLEKKYGIDPTMPIKDLEKDKLSIILDGDKNGTGNTLSTGILGYLKKRYNETDSKFLRRELAKFFTERTCPVCHGKRLNEKALSVKVGDMNIAEMQNHSVDYLINFFENINLDGEKKIIAKQILKEILSRLNFLKDVGLSYLTLSRLSSTLSGGESQRIRLASQIGSGLVGVTYILDEPSIGLHESDNEKLIKTLKHLRDLGNTVIVVEHDKETIENADFIVDVGPGAGVFGGEIVATGSLSDIINCKNSLTGKHLSGELRIERKNKINKFEKGFIKIRGASLHNLKNVDVDIPLGAFSVITGVSGSGKSSLINGLLAPYILNRLGEHHEIEGSIKDVEGTENLDKLIIIDQSPIGKSPRSNPATYTGVFTQIRELFASTKTAREKGYQAGRFSFNLKGGRCEACEGDGEKTVEMYFLPDVTTPCQVCGGKRYNKETLEVKYKGKSIFDVLDMPISEAATFFENLTGINGKIKVLNDVGLGYIKLGQSSLTLSGGEAQRVKLATELSKKQTGKTLYILDEPSTGLHSSDIQKLLDILSALVERGNTVIVIEHNIDIINNADYIVDMGPLGGDKGGKVVYCGEIGGIKKCKESLTAKYIK